MTGGLIGKRVELTVDDPWEFGTIHGVGPFEATVVAADYRDDRLVGLILEMPRQLLFENVDYSRVRVTPRHAGLDLQRLGSGVVPCNLVAVQFQTDGTWMGSSETGLIATLHRLLS